MSEGLPLIILLSIKRIKLRIIDENRIKNEWQEFF